VQLSAPQWEGTQKISVFKRVRDVVGVTAGMGMPAARKSRGSSSVEAGGSVGSVKKCG
jgi:hypothetical protein